MKLLHYTYRQLAWLLLLLMGIWGILFYYTIMDEVLDETDDTLENYSNILINRALNDPKILQNQGTLMLPYTFRPIDAQQGEYYHTTFYDTTVYIEIEDEHEPVRAMRTAFCMPNGQYYELTLMISVLEREDMIEAMLGYLFILYLLLLVVTAIGIRTVLRQVFRPLEVLLHWLHSIEPGKEIPSLNQATQIREFRQLGEAAVDMSQRSYKAYQEQKCFIENASHELQTPLAIVQNKLELLADNENLNEEQLQELDAIFAALGRVVKLNKSLLLLLRIENGQYAKSEQVSVNQCVSQLLPDLLDIYHEKDIQVERQCGELPFCVEANASLVHILVANLLKNALLHTPIGGKIQIVTTSNSLEIYNSGKEPLDSGCLFRRFAHSTQGKTDSNGLGLAIANSIANSYGWNLNYRWEGGMHCFRVLKK